MGPHAAPCGPLAHFMWPLGPSLKIAQVAKTIITFSDIFYIFYIYIPDFLFCASELTQF